MISKKNLKDNDSKEIFLNIIKKEKENGLDEDIYLRAKENFLIRLKEINWDTYYKSWPFNESALTLYEWAPIAEELKILDRKIVLNSMILKWDNIKDEFAKLIKI